jgi:hypothetical protein
VTERRDPEEIGPPCVFLFDREQLVEADSWAYRAPALNALVAATLDVDRAATVCFELRQGDILLHNLAYRTTGVDSSVNERGTRTTSRSTAGDVDLYGTLIWDLSDSLKERWHSLDLSLLEQRLGRLEVSAVSISALGAAERGEIDVALRRFAPYLGAFAPDPGNPIHRQVAERTLIHECDYVRRSLLFDPWKSEDPLDPPSLNRHGDEWYADLPLAGVRYLDETDRADPCAPPWPDAALSERGRRSELLLRQRGDPGHLGRVADVASRVGSAAGDVSFSIDAAAMERAGDAIIEERKLVDYALNLDHDEGGDKARWFLAALGIGRGDWRHLASQLRLGLIGAPVPEVRATEFGVQYAVTTTVSGLNGASARVKSAWEVRDGQPPRLTTVHPAKREEDPPKAPPALVVPDSLQGDERWQALWEIADGRGREAAAAVIPTPINMDGQWYADGAFGFAWIAVPDARRDFARWLRKTDRASLRSGRGAVFMAPGSMIDPARTYAEAFVEVLGMNGVEASLNWKLN